METAASRSLWHETGPDLQSGARLPASADVVVAGAGLTGLVTAVILARAGQRVVVLDAEGIGARTTGGSTAKLSLLQGSTYSALRRKRGDATLRDYAAAQVAGQGWLRETLGGAPEAIETVTAWTYSTTTSGDDALAAEAQAMAAAGLMAEDVGPGEIGLPFTVTSALRMAGQAQLHPVRVLAQLTELARAQGAIFVDACRLLGIERGSGPVVATTSRGDVRANRLVIATGYPVVDRALLFAKLLPSRQIVAAYRLPQGTPMPQDVYLSVDAATRSLRTATGPDGEPVLLVGGESFVPGRERDERRPLASLDEWTARQFPGSERVRWWAAQDYRKSDRRPYFGDMPRTGGRVLAATGFAKWGMTNAVAAGLAIAGRIVGESPAWAPAFGDARIGWRGFGSALGENAAVAGELVRGWVRPQRVDTDPEAGVEARMERRGLRPVGTSSVGGEPCAVSGICTHLGGVLRWNTVEHTWDCPLHGSRFSREGRVLEGPAVQDLRRL